MSITEQSLQAGVRFGRIAYPPCLFPVDGLPRVQRSIQDQPIVDCGNIPITPFDNGMRERRRLRNLEGRRLFRR